MSIFRCQAPANDSRIKLEPAAAIVDRLQGLLAGDIEAEDTHRFQSSARLVPSAARPLNSQRAAVSTPSRLLKNLPRLAHEA